MAEQDDRAAYDALIARRLAELLVAAYRRSTADAPPAAAPASIPWLTASQAAKRAQVSRRVIHAEVRAGRLRAARVGGRSELRLKPEWIDAWLEQRAAPRAGAPSSRSRIR